MSDPHARALHEKSEKRRSLVPRIIRSGEHEQRKLAKKPIQIEVAELGCFPLSLV